MTGPRENSGLREVRERLNPGLGYFYTLGRTLARRRTAYQEVELAESSADKPGEKTATCNF